MPLRPGQSTLHFWRQRLNALLTYKAKVMQPVNEDEINSLISQTVGEEASTGLGAITATNADELSDDGPSEPATPESVGAKPLSQVPPIPGAKRGNDGHWYVRNFGGSSAYSRVL